MRHFIIASLWCAASLLPGLTQAGEEAYAIAKRLNGDASSLKALASDMSNAKEGVLTIATTHTQARYVLPRVVTQFGAKYPGVKLKLKQGNPKQCADWVAGSDPRCVTPVTLNATNSRPRSVAS